MMRERKIKARFVRGGSTQYLVDMLQEGLTDYILDGQTFDLEGVRSMRENPGHVNTSPFTSYNWHGKGNFASMLDAVVLGATEVDVDFNANVVTHSDGRLLHGIGGWQNCLFSKCTILPIPSFRDRIPVLVDEVTTLCGPGELIDVIVTERGIAINPLRRDLLEKLRGLEPAHPPPRRDQGRGRGHRAAAPAAPVAGGEGRGGDQVGGRDGDRQRAAGRKLTPPILPSPKPGSGGAGLCSLQRPDPPGPGCRLRIGPRSPGIGESGSRFDPAVPI